MKCVLADLVKIDFVIKRNEMLNCLQADLHMSSFLFLMFDLAFMLVTSSSNY
jgi:hypothetical protein